MKHDEKMRAKVEFVLEKPYHNGQKIYNLIEIFNKAGIATIHERISRDISQIKAACYYGCLLVRPNDITNFDDPEAPVTMEALVEAAGGKTVDWQFKTECCGASHSIAHTPVVEKLSKQIIDNAAANEANAIIVACPMCHSNLDMRQKGILKQDPGMKAMPILYLSELIGLALGISPKELGLDLHFTDTSALLALNEK